MLAGKGAGGYHAPPGLDVGGFLLLLSRYERSRLLLALLPLPSHRLRDNGGRSSLVFSRAILDYAICSGGHKSENCTCSGESLSVYTAVSRGRRTGGVRGRAKNGRRYILGRSLRCSITP